MPKDLETVELYFDNPKKSGSSGVREVQPGPMDGQAIVYFEDWMGMYITKLNSVVILLLNSFVHRYNKTIFLY